MKIALTIFVGLVIAFAAANADAKVSDRKMDEVIEHCEFVAGLAKSMQEGRQTGINTSPSVVINRYRKIADEMVAAGQMSKAEAASTVRMGKNLSIIVFDYQSLVSPELVYEHLLTDCLRAN